MPCGGSREYHEGQVPYNGTVRKYLKYNPPVPTTAFGEPIIWFDKLTCFEPDGTRKFLYVFENVAKTLRTKLINGMPKEGHEIVATIVPRSKRTKTQFCIVEVEIV